MWAQMIKMRVKPGGEAGLRSALEQLRAAEQPDSGLLHSLPMREQNDPVSFCMLVVFESEEKARAREADPRRSESLEGMRATLATVLEGPPEFLDMTVMDDLLT
jgi:quinol monooxygenase YgiN